MIINNANGKIFPFALLKIERKMKMIQVYNLENNKYMGKFHNTLENIANVVASLTYSAKLVDESTDCIILTTIGNFLDSVPNQAFRNELLYYLIPKQMTMEFDVVELIK